jgi:hypothetical protein
LHLFDLAPKILELIYVGNQNATLKVSLDIQNSCSSPLLTDNVFFLEVLMMEGQYPLA